MDIKTLSIIIGHISSKTALNVYAYVTDEMKQKAAVTIDRGIGKAEPQETPPAPPEKKHDRLPASGKNQMETWDRIYQADPRTPLERTMHDDMAGWHYTHPHGLR